MPDAHPVSEATTFCIASSTKLVTSVAAMQCVERGLIGLEDDVSVLLPELKDAQVFTGIEDGKPVLKKAKNTITLRYAIFDCKINTKVLNAVIFLLIQAGSLYPRKRRLWNIIKRLGIRKARCSCGIS
jgi:hypothetical protein